MILAVTTALLFATGCAKVEDTSPVNDSLQAIGFTNYAPRSLTKAGPTLVNSGALPSGSTIGVYGYSTQDVNFPATSTSPELKPTFMTNLPVAYTETTSATATATTPVRYWPKTTTNLLTFIAYYPYSADNTGAITSKPTASTNAIGSFEFTQAGVVTDMVDFMVSDVANDYYYDASSASNSNGQRSSDGSVPFTLRHMLSKVNFKFAKADGLDGAEIKVTYASIAGVLSKGTLTPTYIAPESAGSPGTTKFGSNNWDASANTAYASAVTIPITSASGDYLILSTTPTLNSTTATNQNFLFVPQTLANTVVVTIAYDITQNENVTTHNTATVQLNQGAGHPSAWNRNDNIVYTFTIGLTPITFKATVQGWADESTGAFTI